MNLKIKLLIILTLVTTINCNDLQLINKDLLKTNNFLKFDKEEKINLLKTFLKSNDLVFDVGANIGKTADLYLTIGCKIICFEPQPTCVTTLKENFASNTSVLIEPVGLSDKESFIDFFICNASKTVSTCLHDLTLNSRFAKNDFFWNQKIKIPVTTLEQMILKHGKPKFIKIDVEGFEYEVISGLKTPVDYISFELLSEYFEKFEKCTNRLHELGYTKFNFCIGEKAEFLFIEWLTSKKFIEMMHFVNTNYNWNDIWGLWGDVYAKIS